MFWITYLFIVYLLPKRAQAGRPGARLQGARRRWRCRLVRRDRRVPNALQPVQPSDDRDAFPTTRRDPVVGERPDGSGARRPAARVRVRATSDCAGRGGRDAPAARYLPRTEDRQQEVVDRGGAAPPRLVRNRLSHRLPDADRRSRGHLLASIARSSATGRRSSRRSHSSTSRSPGRSGR